MNSTKLFKWDFLKENLKKSREILLCLILPILNIILMIEFLNNEKFVIYFNEISIVTIFGMFVIPLLLAYLLFGFLFKKKAIDFYFSKPISRSSFYITNTIGGILIILGIMLLNTLVFGLFGMFSNIAIPLGLLIDYFIFFFVSYVFIFILCVLAIIVTGNFLSTLVVLAILLFLFPFTNFVDSSLRDYYNPDSYIYIDENINNYNCNDEDCYKHLAKNEYYFSTKKINNSIYSTPISLIFNMKYDKKAVIKTVILITIYYVGGLIIFNKRKLEDSKGYLDNPKIHFFIKTMSFFPVMFLVYIVFQELEVVWWIIAILGTIFYYALYDLVTKRKVYNLPISLIIYSITFIIYFVGIMVWGKINSKEATFKQIDSIKIEYYTYNNANYSNFTINDKNLIKKIMIDSLEQNYNKHDDLIVLDSKFSYKNDLYHTFFNIGKNTSNLINDYIIKKKIKNNFQKIDFSKQNFVTVNEIPINLNKDIKNMFLNLDYNNVFESNYPMRYNVYCYTNHEYVSQYIPINASIELENFAINFVNSTYLDNFDDYLYSYIDDSEKAEKFGIYQNVFSYFINNNRDKFYEYLLEHKNDKISDDYLMIYSFNNKPYYYYINDIKSFKEFYQEFVNIYKNDKNYIEMMEANEY